VSEQDFMNITLGSLRDRDLRALEDLDLLPRDVDEEQESRYQAEQPRRAVSQTPTPDDSVATSSGNGLARISRIGSTGGISWFEDMIQGSQLGHYSKMRKGHGTSADGTTVVSWEVSEYYGSNEAEISSGSKRKAGEIATDDTTMDG